MLDEVIEYLKQLQAQVQMMSKMSCIPQLMMPISMQQLQMSMMAQMSMMGVMDMNRLHQTSHAAAVPPMLHPAAFFPLTAAWDGSGDRLPTPGSFLPDPLSMAFLACQTQVDCRSHDLSSTSLGLHWYFHSNHELQSLFERFHYRHAYAL